MEAGQPYLVVAGAQAAVLERLSSALGDLVEVVPGELSPEKSALGGHCPAVVVIDLGLRDSLKQLSLWRDSCPEAIIVCHLVLPDRQLWEQAERSGADLVCNRGALARSLRQLLSQRAPGRGRSRYALFDSAEIAGRLGLVQAVDDTPVGPVAVWRTDAGLACAADVCPHAGARLSQGGYESPVVTCPAHGSQFDVRTGERLRGPADCHIRTFGTLEEGGRLWMLWA